MGSFSSAIHGLHSYFSFTSPKGRKHLLIGGAIFALATVGLYWLLYSVGIPVVWHIHVITDVHISLLTVIMMALFIIDGVVYIETHHPDGRTPHYALASFLAMLALVASIAVHEIMHGVVSSQFGNQIHHAGISWWGAFVSPTGSLGGMKPHEQILVALAGPGTNLFIAGLFTLYVWAFKESLHENTMQYIAATNFRLFKWNLVPMFVFDGGKAVDGLLRYIITDTLWRAIAMGAVFGLFINLYRKYRKTHPKPIEDFLVTL